MPGEKKRGASSASAGYPMTLKAIRSALAELADAGRAKNLRRYFKTGPGEYGEGDRFIGIKVPDLRKLAKRCRDVPEVVTDELLKSEVHEERLLALLVYVDRYKRGTDSEKEEIYTSYLANTRHVNNWDLVDLTAGHIVGEHLLGRDKAALYILARSADLWERRISIIATSAFIARGEFAHTMRIAETLLEDEEDLIHKAVGWMLREVGKMDLNAEEEFLKPRYKRMPRTMLRYAIEKFPEGKRQKYLKGNI
jgi:3-methyladenine DNA glycosylase AlkD